MFFFPQIDVFLKGGALKFSYDKDHAIINPDNRTLSRENTSNSHQSEKKLTKEYMSQLYDYGIEKVFSYILNKFK